MRLVLFLILIAVALGIIGVVVHGLFDLLIIGVVVLVLALTIAGLRSRHKRRHPGR